VEEIEVEAKEDASAEAEPDKEESADEEEEKSPAKKQAGRVDRSLAKGLPKPSPKTKKHVLSKEDKVFEIENVRQVHPGNVVKKSEDYKRFKDNPRSLIGHLVVVHWPEQKCCYVGKVKRWDPNEKNHISMHEASERVFVVFICSFAFLFNFVSLLVYYFNDRSEVEHDFADEVWCFAREQFSNWTMK
jgi:hypothetical protein